MHYYGPDTSRTDRACEHCNHFGGWVEQDEGAVWCVKSLMVHALSYSGCAYWEDQPVGWLYPPEVEPAPGLRIYGTGRQSTARIR